MYAKTLSRRDMTERHREGQQCMEDETKFLQMDEQEVKVERHQYGER